MGITSTERATVVVEASRHGAACRVTQATPSIQVAINSWISLVEHVRVVWTCSTVTCQVAVTSCAGGIAKATSSIAVAVDAGIGFVEHIRVVRTRSSMAVVVTDSGRVSEPTVSIEVAIYSRVGSIGKV